MRVSPWATVKKLPEKLKAVTPPPPPIKEEQKKSMGFKFSFSDDKLADSCLGIGLLATGFLLSWAVGFVGDQWNGLQANAYFQRANDLIAGEHAREMTRAYREGMFLSARLLYHDGLPKIAQAAPEASKNERP